MWKNWDSGQLRHETVETVETVPDMVFYFRLTLFESSLFSGLIVIFVK